jgi:transposase
MISLISELIQDWRRLDERITAVSAEIEVLAKQDAGCQRLMSIPGVGPIISSAVVAAIGSAVIPRNVFTQPRPEADLGRIEISQCNGRLTCGMLPTSLAGARRCISID